MNSHSSWFADRLPFVQLITEDRRVTLERMHQGTFSSLDHYQQLMVLEAGIIGVVIPILHAQGPGFANPWFLKRAVIWLGGSMMIGILISAVSRWTLVMVTLMVQNHYAIQNTLIGDAVDEDGARAALNKADSEYAPKAERLRRVLYAGAIGDLLFYGTFLRGVAYVVQGFVW
jgi:hypothetical protein